MNKINKLILIGSFLFILPFSTKKVEANELAMTAPSLETNAEIFPTRVWTTVSIKSWAPTYFYTTDGRSGAIYRGYLTRVSDISLVGYNTYEGYLYRSDLPYPIPARLIPETTSKWEGGSIFEKNIKE